MVNIRFVKVWIDDEEPFCEILCYANSQYVSIKTKFYVMDEKIIQLADNLEEFVNRDTYECFWANSIDETKPDFSLKAHYMDRSGHIRLEIFAIVDDRPEHSCCFFIDGLEPEMLLRFCKQLRNIQLNGVASMIDTI